MPETAVRVGSEPRTLVQTRTRTGLSSSFSSTETDLVCPSPDPFQSVQHLPPLRSRVQVPVWEWVFQRVVEAQSPQGLKSVISPLGHD